MTEEELENSAFFELLSAIDAARSAAVGSFMSCAPSDEVLIKAKEMTKHDIIKEAIEIVLEARKKVSE